MPTQESIPEPDDRPDEVENKIQDDASNPSTRDEEPVDPTTTLPESAGPTSTLGETVPPTAAFETENENKYPTSGYVSSPPLQTYDEPRPTPEPAPYPTAPAPFPATAATGPGPTAPVISEPTGREVRMRTVVFGLVLLVIAGSVLVGQLTDVTVDAGAVLLALMIGGGVLLLAGARRN
jgi:hypothetical protein